MTNPKTAFGPLFLLLIGIGISKSTPADEPAPAASPPATLKGLLVQQVKLKREEESLIGLAAWATIDGQVVASAVAGTRTKRGEDALSLSHSWHLGSITKSMTATMLGRLIEQDLLDWSTTVAECFGETIELHADWRDVQIQQLLTHTSGAPPNFGMRYLFQQPTGDAIVPARKQAVSAVLRKPSNDPSGKTFAYSNVGFTIAAVMAEEKLQMSWEDLMKRELFDPLKLTHAGFGAPRDTDSLKQPRGHQKLGPLKRVVGQNTDNSFVMAPAGAIHMTLEELCRYGYEHMQGELGRGTLLKQNTYQRLHRVERNGYACGWVIFNEAPWANGHRVIWHNGSNTLWYAFLAIIPEKRMVIGIAANDGDMNKAESAALDIIAKLTSHVAGMKGSTARPAQPID